MRAGNGAYTNSADPSGPFAGFDKRLFKGDEDLLSQIFKLLLNQVKIDIILFQQFIL